VAVTDDLGTTADRLLAADTAQHLISILEDELPRLGAAPAALYLYDAKAVSYYPVAGFGQPQPHGDVPELLVPDGSLRLASLGQPVGLLVVAPGAHREAAVRHLSTLLGPLLVQLHRRQIVVEELRETREIVSQLAVAGDLLRHFDLEVLLTKLLETALNAVGAQVGAVQLPDANGNLEMRVSWGLTAEHLAAIRLKDGCPVAQAVFTSGNPVMVTRTERKTMLDISGLQERLEGLLALALISRDRILGVLLLANPIQDFGPAKRRLAETLCNLAGTAIDNTTLVKDAIERERLRQEIDIARTVQEKMFPTSGLVLGDLTVEGWSRPCNETGGDYYAYLPRPGGLVTMVGDVSGHGLGAALFTTMAHALAQQQFRAGADLATAFRQVNEGLFHTRSGRFMTAAAVSVDSATGVCEYVSAGHTRSLWIHRGEARWLDSTAMPLGIMQSLDIDPSPQLILDPGDLLLLYTDGITEATHEDGATLGEERLADTVLAAWRSRLSPRRVLDLVAAAVDGFTAGRAQADDLTGVALTRARCAGDAADSGWQLAVRS
jgi:sigma-B regulation protein RsbU (phosphoserine phosphatase)